MAVRIARLGLIPISELGTVLNKNTATIKEMCRATSEIRILPDGALPNTANSPTVETYLVLEDGDGFSLQHLDQTTVITGT